METKVDSVPNPESSASGENQDDKVAYSTYKRVLAEAKKFKELAENLSKQSEAENEKKLKDQNEWKTIAELNKQKLDQATKELEEKNRAIQDGMKFSEFQKHLGGTIKHSSYTNLIDFDKIVVNPETGMVDEGTVKSYAAEFLKEHSALVSFGGKPRMPNESARSVTMASKGVDEMSKEELEKYILDQARVGKIK